MSKRDLHDLERSGIMAETILANGIRTVDAEEMATILNRMADDPWKQLPDVCIGGGMVFPYADLNGEVNCFGRVKPRCPAIRDGKVTKYESPKGSVVRAYFPVAGLPLLRDGKSPVYVTEGEKKALALSQLGLAAVGLGGVCCGTMRSNKKKDGGHQLIPDLAEITWQDREVYIVFDYDEKEDTQNQTDLARTRLATALTKAGAAVVYLVDLPPGPDGGKQGVDDYLVAHGAEAFHQIIQRSQAANELTPIPVDQLVRQYPELRPAVVEGVARQGETVNVIAPSKAGKSWCMYGLAFSVANGLPWFDKFPTCEGGVLLIDNELHPETIAHRLREVSKAKSLSLHGIDVLSLRGQQQSYDDLSRKLVRHFKTTDYRAVIVDAHYRMLPPGVPENGNSELKDVYNLIDALAARTSAAWFLVHHPSKGDQTVKEVVDIGAGGGAQARAADCHLVLRKHKDPGCYALEAAVRSFSPLTPTVLRWCYPLWTYVPDANAADLSNPKEDKQQAKHQADRQANVRKIAKALASLTEPISGNKLSQKLGMGRANCCGHLHRLVKQGLVQDHELDASGNRTKGYTLTEKGVVWVQGGCLDNP